MKTTFYLILFLLLVKCSTAQPGNYVWATNYSDTYNDRGNSIAVDNSANVIIAGTTQITSTSSPTYIFIAKYNSDGVQLWTATYTDFATQAGPIQKVAVDGSGNVYVCGYTLGSGDLTHVTTLKYNSSGVFQWASIYGGYSIFFDMRIDGSANIYITGWENVSNHLNILTLKYDASGTPLWNNNYLPSGYNLTLGNGLAIDGSSSPNVYVAGEIAISGNGTEDYLVIKYNNVGLQQWVSTFNGGANSTDEALAVCVDESTTPNVYVTGRSWNGTSFDFATVKFGVPLVFSSGQEHTSVSDQYLCSQNLPYARNQC